MKWLLILFIIAIKLQGQDGEINQRIAGELKMTFPSIYFKHNSTDYAKMPYTADSCLKYIALNFDNNLNDLVIWRDSLETEKLTKQRIKKIKMELSKYKVSGIYIESMGKRQKISRRTIETIIDPIQITYLLSLNSVFDISMTHFQEGDQSKVMNHVLHPKIWCWSCWKSGFHLDRRSREMRKMERRRLQTVVK